MAEKDKSELQFESFSSEVIRGPRKGIYEQILAQHLINAVSSKPLKKIRLVSEAAMMLPEPKNVGIDITEVNVLHKVAIGFIQASHHKFGGATYCFIPWPFPDVKDDYAKYISVWRQDIRINYYPLLRAFVATYERKKYEAKCEEISVKISQMPLWKQFFWMTRRGQLCEGSFVSLVSQFTAWALPKIQQAYGKVAKQINPDVYNEVLKALGKKSEEE